MNDVLKTFLRELREIPGFTSIEEISSDTVGGFGDTPLHVAAVRGDTDIVNLLVATGADPNAKGEHGYTPLHEAAAQGHPATVDALLKLGANPDILNDEKKTFRQMIAEAQEDLPTNSA